VRNVDTTVGKKEGTKKKGQGQKPPCLCKVYRGGNKQK
jgi:hypothetical protein